ncbi:MAG: hypothetical protein OXI10_01755 [Gammaproteobacteria bacterium]|nr:hypothetical protein [Gammaproteobacteria bacterium]
MNKSIPDLLSSAGISTLFLVIVFWIFKGIIRQWISTYLKSSIEHQYTEKLEIHKAQLTAHNEIEFIRIRNQLEQQNSIYESLRSSFSEGQKSSMDRKLDAVDQLWSEVLKIRAILPPKILLIDIFGENETSRYEELRNSNEGSRLLDAWSLHDYKEKMNSLSSTVDDIRPYTGEYLWAIFHGYRIIHMRLSVMLQFDEDGTSAVHWYKDELNTGIITAILDNEELGKFNHLEFGKYSWLQRTLEQKILAQIQKIVSGEKYLEDTSEKLGVDALEKIRAAQINNQNSSPYPF